MNLFQASVRIGRPSISATEALRQPWQRRPGLVPVAYDTAWLASLPWPNDTWRPRFPACLDWLASNQLTDGSWGSTIGYEHDRVISTLAALTPLAIFGAQEPQQRAALERGTRYLWRNGHLLAGEDAKLVGFELLLRTLIQRARAAGIALPPGLGMYSTHQAEELALIPPSALYTPRARAVQALEFLGDTTDPSRFSWALSGNGSMGNSPAATAFYLCRQNNPRAWRYLEQTLTHAGGSAAAVTYPCETFELLWTAYHLHLGSGERPSLQLFDQRYLEMALRTGGVSLSASYPIADADNTAIALVLLQALGSRVDATVLHQFRGDDGHFSTYPHERQASTITNIHVLHALLRLAGGSDRDRLIDGLVDYLVGQLADNRYWLDKGHISPYQATAHALCVLDELPVPWATKLKPILRRSRDWLRETQNPDGSWGFFKRATVEETAYGALALTRSSDSSEGDLDRCTAAAQYLASALSRPELDMAELFPALWVHKCLYAPELVIQAVVEGALMGCARLVAQKLPALESVGPEGGIMGSGRQMMAEYQAG